MNKQELDKRIKEEITKKMESKFKSLILFDKEVDELIYYKTKKKEQLETLKTDLEIMEFNFKHETFWEKEYYELMSSTFIKKFLPRKINELESEIYALKKIKYEDEFRFELPINNEKLSKLILEFDELESKETSNNKK